jgi:hypothetical protein
MGGAGFFKKIKFLWSLTTEGESYSCWLSLQNGYGLLNTVHMCGNGSGQGEKGIQMEEI